MSRSNLALVLAALMCAIACSAEERSGEAVEHAAQRATDAPEARVERFIADFGAAWHEVRGQFDQDPFAGLERWDAAASRMDAEHFVPGASCGAQGAFSRTQADHDPRTERVLTSSVDGDRASVRTDGPHPSFSNRRVQYVYSLARSGDGWRIASVVLDEGAAAPSVGASEVPELPPPVRAGPGPDYSAVDRNAALAMLRAGELASVLLLPAELGGTDDPRNVVYVPPFVVERKRHIDLDVVRPMIDSGRVRRYTATPEYQGTSVIPIAIHIRAHDPGEFVADIAIWGASLE